MISYTELTEKHKFEPESIARVLDVALETDHLFLYENQMFDSSMFGRQHLMVVGPGRTFPDPENPPPWIDPDNCGGLPSRREQLVGEVDIDDVRKQVGGDDA